MAAFIEDPYRTLQVEPSADLESIRAAYRRLAREYHPDLNPRPEAASRMRAINAAYALLSDPAQRASYDARRYLPRTQPMRASVAPRVRPVVMAASPPTPLQRRVDRGVAILGILLVIGIAFYTVNVIPFAEQQQAQLERPRLQLARPTAAAALASTPQVPAGDHPPPAAVPDRLRLDDALHSFPGTVLVAPSNLQPFASLPILRAEAASRGIARYAVYYGDLTTGSATISGLIGRTSFDSGAPRLQECSPDGSYCAGLAPGQSSGPPGLELFRAPGLVDDFEAYATHRVCCNGVFWSLSWYEPHANMTYSIDVSRSAASAFGSPTAEADGSAAHAFAALASQLVRLP